MAGIGLVLLALSCLGFLVDAQTQVKIGSKVFFVSDEVMTWKEAATFCVRPEFNYRFEVAKIENLNQNTAAASVVSRVNNADGQTIDGWIGGYRRANKWTWSDLSSFSKTFWNSGHPQAGKNCLSLRYKTGVGGVWVSADCAEKRRAICQAYAFSKIYDFLAREQLLNKTSAAAICAARGAGLATVTSEAEGEGVEHQTTRPTTVPDSKSPTLAPVTKRPTAKPSRSKKCCAGNSRFGCCINTQSTTPCDNCKCCCCIPGRKNYKACCSSSDNLMCGCKNSGSPPPTNRGGPTRFPTRRPTFKPTRRIPSRLLEAIYGPQYSDDLEASEEEFSDDYLEGSNDEDAEEGTKRILASTPPIVFLNAFNAKVGAVKEENASFIWSNGVSFKSVGYIPSNLTRPHSNFATYPRQNNSESCIIFDGADGKWRSAPCNLQANGAMCEVLIDMKLFRVVLDQGQLEETDAGDACAASGGQLASIKTEAERTAAINAIKSANSKCSKCVTQVWTSGIAFGASLSFYWQDGMLFSRNGNTVGLNKGLVNATATSGLCVGLTKKGDLFRQDCTELAYPLCEYPAPNANQIPPPFVPADSCFAGCLPVMRGDGQCDPVCNHFTCKYDGDDCGTCAPGCLNTQISNGICEPECFTASCAFDKADCFSNATSGSRLLSTSDVITPQDTPLRTLQQSIALPDVCFQTSDQCKPDWVGDKYCDIIACGRECDQDDCKDVSSTVTCDDTCRNADLFNNRCDKGCATLGCNFDGGFCPVACPSSCGANITLNQCTKPACDIPMCRFDIGFCRDSANVTLRCSPGCDSRLIGNGQCNSGCNNAACSWDGGDCPQKEFCPYPVTVEEYGCLDQCNNPLFKFQQGACENKCLVNGCSLEKLGNGICNPECNTAACGMDRGDCPQCAPGCNSFELNNGICTASCNLPGTCGNDGGDCL